MDFPSMYTTSEYPRIVIVAEKIDYKYTIVRKY